MDLASLDQVGRLHPRQMKRCSRTPTPPTRRGSWSEVGLQEARAAQCHALCVEPPAVRGKSDDATMAPDSLIVGRSDQAPRARRFNSWLRPIHRAQSRCRAGESPVLGCREDVQAAAVQREPGRDLGEQPGREGDLVAPHGWPTGRSWKRPSSIRPSNAAAIASRKANAASRLPASKYTWACQLATAARDKIGHGGFSVLATAAGALGAVAVFSQGVHDPFAMVSWMITPSLAVPPDPQAARSAPSTASASGRPGPAPTTVTHLPPRPFGLARHAGHAVAGGGRLARLLAQALRKRVAACRAHPAASVE